MRLFLSYVEQSLSCWVHLSPLKGIVPQGVFGWVGPTPCGTRDSGQRQKFCSIDDIYTYPVQENAHTWMETGSTLQG